MAQAYNAAKEQPDKTVLVGWSWETHLRIVAIGSYAVALGSNSLTLAGGINGLCMSVPGNAMLPGVLGVQMALLGGGGAPPPPVPAQPLNNAGPSRLDKLEFWFLMPVAVGFVVFDIMQIIRGATGREFDGSITHTADFDVAKVSKLLLARDMLSSTMRLTGWMFNRKFTSMAETSPELYLGVAAARAVTGVGALALHGSVMFGYMTPD